MAFHLPVVAFDLRETRVSAADAALYVRPNDVEEYARAVVSLIDDPGQRFKVDDSHAIDAWINATVMF